MIDSQRVDFIGVPVSDLARADEFYGKTLGLTRNPNSSERWVEYELARRKLEEAGVEFSHETIDSGVCHLATFRDPDGNALQLHRRYAPYRDGSLP